MKQIQLFKILGIFIVAIFSIALASAYVCFQETVNQSTVCGGVNTGVYGDALEWTDGNYATYTYNVSSFDNVQGTYYENVTVPNNTVSQVLSIVYDYFPGSGECIFGVGLIYHNITINNSYIFNTNKLALKYQYTYVGTCGKTSACDRYFNLSVYNSTSGLYDQYYSDLYAHVSGGIHICPYNLGRFYETAWFWNMTPYCGMGVNSYMSLDRNLTCNSTVINVYGQDYGIDGNGYSIIGNTSNTGMNFMPDSLNVTVSNLTFSNFSKDVYQNSSTNTTRWCNQETATVGNDCGGLSTGAYAYDGAYIYINYTKPVLSYNNSYWYLVYGYSMSPNIAIPFDCWNQSNTLQFRLYSSTSNPATQDEMSYGECYNGSNWNTITAISEWIYGSAYNPQSYNLLNQTAVIDGDYNTLGCYMAGSLGNNTGGRWISDSTCTGSYLGWGATIWEERMVWNTSVVNPNVLLNSVYNKSKVNVTAGVMDFKWYAYVNVTNLIYQAISSATLNITDRFSSAIFNGFTGSSGYPSLNTLTEFRRNSTADLYYSNYSFSTYKIGYLLTSNSSKSINLTSNAFVNLLLNVPHSINSISLTNTDFLSTYQVAVNITDVDNAIGWVNVSVQLNNGSLYYYNTSLVNGLYVTRNLTLFNGTTIFNVTSDDGTNSSYNVTTTNNQIISPTVYAQTVIAGQNFSYEVSISSNTTALVNYTIACNVPSNISCFAPSSIVSNITGGFNVTVNTSVNTSDGVYLGNLTITRLLDGYSVMINMTLGVSNKVGQPFIVNSSTTPIITSSNAVSTAIFVLQNIGNYNLSNCTATLDSSFTGWSFYSFSNVSFLEVNASTNFTVTFSSPPVGAYAGYLQITCIATSGGLQNSLNSNNRPLIALSSSAPVAPPSGGGGGAPYIPPVTVGTNETFKIETDAGGSSSGLYFYPGQSRDLSLVISSLITSDQEISLKCEGDFCKNVVLSKNTIKLSGKSFDIVLMSMIVPEDTPYGKTFAFSIVGADASKNTKKLDVQIEVAQIASFVNKFALQVKPGDEGYLTTLGGINVPKIAFYVLFIGVFGAILAWIIPNKGAGGKNPQAFWIPMLCIIAGVVVILLV